ncbi:MAG TPA: hypothetical protein VNX40_09460 [Mucilaginibacter sp.]|jgi:hypothetical protein|nr:hypothetical protein [Mucilaginibacter sp.]
MVTISSTLEDIMKLDYASREMLLEILQKRQIEVCKDGIARSAKISLKEYHSGKITPVTADEAIRKLEAL